MRDFSATLGNFTFANPLMNASGVHCLTAQDLDEIAASASGAVVTKSGTLEPREGNPKPRYARLELGSINSMGLPNMGLPYYIDYVEKFQDEHPDQPIILSVAGLSPSDYPKLAEAIENSNYRGLTEFNLSCPNVPGEPQIAYDLKTTEEVLEEVFSIFTKPAGVKLPPFFDLVQFDQMAAVLNRFPLTFINSINSLGNGLMIDPETDTVLIRPKGGFGGVGGDYAKPIALANVRAFRQRLRPEIQIIGTGGIKSGRDIYDLVLCGADVVQVGSALYEEGPAIFERLLTELDAVLAEKGYDSLDAVRNQLKTID